MQSNSWQVGLLVFTSTQLHTLLPLRILGYQVTENDKFTLLIILEHLLLGGQYVICVLLDVFLPATPKTTSIWKARAHLHLDAHVHAHAYAHAHAHAHAHDNAHAASMPMIMFMFRVLRWIAALHLAGGRGAVQAPAR